MNEDGFLQVCRGARGEPCSEIGVFAGVPVTGAAPKCNPNRLTATAAAGSKKLDVPTRAAGAAVVNGTRRRYARPWAMANMPQLRTSNGKAIMPIAKGLSMMVCA